MIGFHDGRDDLDSSGFSGKSLAFCKKLLVKFGDIDRSR